MSTFNQKQLSAFLNLLHEPAQIYDVCGNLVAENSASQATEWPDVSGGISHMGAVMGSATSNSGATLNQASVHTSAPIHTIDLGEGWFMRRMSVPGAVGAPLTLSGAPGARPNLQALLAGITHELRNPLAAILTAISLLKDDTQLSEESMMLLDVVRKEARRMNQIMVEFSLYVKPPQPHPENFDVARLLRETQDGMQREGDWSAELKLEDHLPPTLFVYADEKQVHQVILRLLDNAVEAVSSREDAQIALFSYEQADTGRVVICIEDNGAGFTEEEMQRAFVPFFTTKPQSTGLGLSTVQVALQSAGGAVWLEKPVSSASAKTTNEKAEHPTGARVCFALPGRSE